MALAGQLNGRANLRWAHMIVAVACLLIVAPLHAAPVSVAAQRGVADGLAQSMFPMALNTGPSSAASMSIVDAVYCGPSASEASANAVALIQWTEGATAVQVLGPGDCQASPASIAVRAASARVTVAAAAEIRFAPWQVSVVIREAAGAAPAGKADALTKVVRDTFVTTHTPAAVIDTSSIAIPVAGASSPLKYRLGLRFGVDSVTTVLVPEAEAGGGLPTSAGEQGPTAAERGGTNRVVIAAPYVEVIRLLSALSSGGTPITLHAAGQDLVMHGLHVDGAADVFHLLATATHIATGATVDVACTFAGADLTLANIALSPQLQGCPSRPPGKQVCEAKNRVISQAAAAFSSQLTSSYAGQSLRPSSSHPFPAVVNGNSINVDVTILKTKASASALWLVGVVSLTR